MPPLHHPDIFHRPRKQQGAALLIMLVIVVVGAATVLVGSLSSTGLRIERDKITAAALAQAKDALIGYAVSDLNRPGELPCPDINDDGKITIVSTVNDPIPDYNGSNCISLIGRLPWKTLGLPDLRDSSGERLWYALSNPFHASGTTDLNSDTTGNLTVSGTTSAGNVIAIVFSPGNVLSGKSRSSTQSAACTTTNSAVFESWCATNYLEGSNVSLSTHTTPNTNYQTAAASTTFNDQMIFITRDHIFPAVEMRIAREAKSCLDVYAASSARKYPWAVPVTNTAGYTGVRDTRFGRLSNQPSNITSTTNDPSVDALLNALSALQIALNNYAANITSSTTAALSNAGIILEDAAGTVNNAQPTIPVVSITATVHADDASNLAQKLAKEIGTVVINDVQSKINSANAALPGISPATNDTTMLTTWPSSCTLFTSSYWPAWRNLVFYQVADGYRPGVSSPACGASCLSISGSGNTAGGSGSYRAAVLVARRAIGGQVRNPTDSTTYLENLNRHQATPTTAFETYNASDLLNYPNVNDLVLCLDGKNNCK